jgi:hypothetical protein
MDIIKDWLFIHPPKTGGSTISAIVNSPTVKPKLDTIHLGMHTPRSSRCVQHESGLIDLIPFTKCLVVVRHPLNRLVSLFVQSVAYTDQYDLCQRCGLYACVTHDHHDAHDWFSRLNEFNFNQTLEMLKLNGDLPETIYTLRFEHIQQDFKKFMYDELGVRILKFPHVNRKLSVYTDMYDELLSDPYLINLVNKRSKRELEFLKFTKPEFFG